MFVNVHMFNSQNGHQIWDGRLFPRTSTPGIVFKGLPKQPIFNGAYPMATPETRRLAAAQVYDFVKPLGSGTFGVVREVKSKNRKNRRAPSHFAVKTIPNTAGQPGGGSIKKIQIYKII